MGGGAEGCFCIFLEVDWFVVAVVVVAIVVVVIVVVIAVGIAIAVSFSFAGAAWVGCWECCVFLRSLFGCCCCC